MKLDLTAEEAREILWDEDDYEIVKDDIIDTTRWSEIHTLVIKRRSDGKFFMDRYSRGLTEMQDESPWEYSKPNFVEVVPYEKVIIDYKVVEDDKLQSDEQEQEKAS